MVAASRRADGSLFEIKWIHLVETEETFLWEENMNACLECLYHFSVFEVKEDIVV